jgi:drug/metabolite transporter (DMT)-like permease
VLWSIAGIVTRKLTSAQGLEVTFWRSFFCAVFVAFWLIFKQGSHAFDAVKNSGKYGFISGCMWAVMFTCFMIALTMTTAANTLIVNSLMPLFTAVLSWLYLKEKVSTTTWVAITLATLGMGYMFSSGLQGNVGTLIAFGVPIAAAMNIVVLKKVGAHLDLIPSVLMGGVISAVVVLPFALPLQANPHDMVLLAGLGLFQLALPCALYVSCSKHLSATDIPLLALLEVLLGPLWTWLFANEVPAHTTLVGGGVVLFALVYNELARPKHG